MINTFLASFKVSFATGGNTFIYFLKRVPLLGKVISDNLYKETNIKIVLGIISEIFSIIGGFLKKALYLGLMILLPSFLINHYLLKDINLLPEFLHIFFFLSFIIGTLSKPIIFDKQNKKAYDMIVLMRADAKEFYLFELLINRIMNFIWFTLPLVIIGNFIGLSAGKAAVTILELTAFKFIGEWLYVFIYEKKVKGLKDKSFDDNSLIISIIVIAALIFAYALPSFGWTIKFDSLLFNLMFESISVIAGTMALIYLFRYRKYKAIAKKFLTMDSITSFDDIMKDAKFSDVKVDEDKISKESLDKEIYKDKQGYEYLNALFFLRHKRIISRPIRTRVIIIGIGFIACVTAALFFPQSKEKLTVVIHNGAPAWVFIMYLMSTTERVCRAMFHNCDVSLLGYAFYREGKVILTNFTYRLRRIVFFNLIPAFVLCIALCLVLLISGARNLIIGTIPIFLCIICLSCFFSIHYLFMYYVLQPYTKNMEVKSPLFKFINGAVYFLSYISIKIKTTSLYFAYGVIGVTFVYMMIALYLTYKLAPKTFRLK
ncbi:hypothetical protein SH2C18_48300 [Clostridium sediminicola]|uniref:hypothetical protein n=1 Tax=Clostridium sediminicola TaxID=3114879 RepID=UPI0031F21B66